MATLTAEEALTDSHLAAMRNDGRWLGANGRANFLQDWSIKGAHLSVNRIVIF
ncbi:MAG: hypothetical protein ABGY95_11860 [Rubritalea sp.]|uniref:hypothetical protein n=1 Tax=Rubritalea sp. TaxID=2109375 RepID=UPI0032427599